MLPCCSGALLPVLAHDAPADYANGGAGLTELPEVALAGFPDVAAIIAAGAVHHQ